ncbi:MAG: TauD/TfdA family dioxygenase [Burkholderiales bacterium]
MNPADSPFDLDKERAYREWRERKLENYPSRLEQLLVEVADPRAPTAAEHEAVLDLCRKTNMAIYVSPMGVRPDKDIPRLFGLSFGLERLDTHLMADEDGLSELTVSGSGGKGDFIPYTDRPIRWHTDGYYNAPERQIRSVQLYCVQRAEEGGDNQLLDHDIAYIRLRDENPEHIRALMQPDAMIIPARMDEDGEARPDQGGPVFSLLPDSGSLHMRYTARTRSIAWKQDAATLAAVAALEKILAEPSPYIFQGRLEPGMGLICNNVLHDRSGFRDSPQHKRLIYRARYYDRIAGTGWNDI